MTDQTIHADKVRKIVNDMRRHADHDAVRGREEEYVGQFADLLEALLPAPSRPTLADMTPEERDACQWMQANVKGYESRVVIANPCWSDGSARVMWLQTRMREVTWKSVTPRPDLPRLEWPGDQKPAPALPGGWRLADHREHGRVIVTNTTPNCYGRVYFVAPATGYARGFDWHSCDPDELTFLDNPTAKGDGTPTGPDHLAVGTVIESADDPRIDALPVGSVLLDLDEEATMKRPWEWEGEGYIPIPSEGDKLGPWTVLHIPKEKA